MLDFLSPPKIVSVALICVICSFFSAARRTNQEAPPRLSGFWLVATVAVGVCGTRFARIVLALFPPSSLRLHRPIKAESGDLACILTPSPFGHSPYIPLRKHRGRGGLTLLLPLQAFLTPLLVATLLISPIFLRHTPQCFGARQGRRVIVTLRSLQCDTPHTGYGKGGL